MSVLWPKYDIQQQSTCNCIDICTDLINNSYIDNNISSSISDIAKVCSQFGR